MPLGLKIKEIRKKRGLTQKQLGALCGIADSNIRKYENGQQNPKIETLRKIAHALYVSVIENNGHFELLSKDQTITKLIDHITPEILIAYPDLDHALRNYVEELFSVYHFSFETDGFTRDNAFKDFDLNQRAELYNSILHHINIKIANGMRYFDIYPVISLPSNSDLFINNLQKVCQLLNEKGKHKLINYAEDLTKIPEYRKQQPDTSEEPAVSDLLAAHARTDVEQTPEGIQHDLDIMKDDKNWK